MARLGLWFDLLERARIEDMRRAQRIRRHRRATVDPFNMPDAEFIATYRLSKSLVYNLIEELEPFIRRRRRIGDASIEIKVLTALSFYASGSYQRGVGQNSAHSLSQQTVSKCLREVTEALNHTSLRAKYIRFPQSVEERNNLKTEFFRAFGIPGVLGCIDGTHVSLVRPAVAEHRFFNRKRQHSLNTQIICDASLNILSVDASHPGADHDAAVWRHHPVNRHLQELWERNETTWLLGDSGYPQRKWMMTPILHAAPGSPEEHYTTMHVRARNVVERCFGVLKSRWRCLLYHRVLHYDPHMVGSIINACVILHNIANRAGLPVEQLSAADQMGVDTEDAARGPPAVEAAPSRGAQELIEGRAARDTLVNRLWRDRHRAP